MSTRPDAFPIVDLQRSSMNSNTCQPSHVSVTMADGGGPKSAPKPSSVASNSIYSNYSVKQTSSGSETDLSSTENLTPEEHFVLKTGIRQEPQGEETYLDINATSDCLSFNNTLIIHENGALNNYNYMSPYLYGKLANNIYAEVIPKEQIPKNDSFYYHSHSISEQSTVNGFPNNDKPEMPNSNIASMIDNDSPYSNLNLIKFGQSNAPNNQLYFENQSVIKLPSTCQQNQIASNDASISLQQPMLNNYLNSMKNDPLLIKSFNADKVPLPPPPPSVEYEKQLHAFQIGSNSSKSCERLAISRSHPDLSKFTDEELTFVSNLSYGYNQQSSPFYRNNAIEMLVTENAALRSQLDLYINKVKRLQNFELEIQKVHQSHEELMKSSEKKERLEQTWRLRLDMACKQLQEQNRCLKEQLESAANKRGNFDEGDVDVLELKKEINKRDSLISRLVAQSKEYNSDKERQEIELQAQRLTLQEQRNHIEILDTALMNAQNNIILLENEIRKKHEFEERTLFLKKALSNLQLANDRRLQMEKRVRTQLEKEIEELKKQNAPEVNNDDGKHCEKDLDSLKKIIRDYGEKIINLEAEKCEWEQKCIKCLEESTLRSIEVSAASAPKDAKIAALERTSQESEKMIAEARNEKLKHMDEIHLTKKMLAELEGKLKDAETRLKEQDSMIQVLQNVLQKQSDDRTAVLQKSLVRRFPTRHTRSASTMGLVVSANGTGSAMNVVSSSDVHPDVLASEFSKLLVSTGSPLSNNLVQNPECAQSPMSDSVDNLNEQLREIDSRFSPKDSIINALRNEKERYPNHYNNWRL